MMHALWEKGEQLSCDDGTSRAIDDTSPRAAVVSHRRVSHNSAVSPTKQIGSPFPGTSRMVYYGVYSTRKGLDIEIVDAYVLGYNDETADFDYQTIGSGVAGDSGTTTHRVVIKFRRPVATTVSTICSRLLTSRLVLWICLVVATCTTSMRNSSRRFNDARVSEQQ